MTRKVGEVIRELRSEAGLSLRDLSKKTGLAAGYLSLIETGARKDPGFKTVLSIVQKLGISMQDVADRLDGPTEGPRTASTEGVVLKALLEVEKAQAAILAVSGRLDRVRTALETPAKGTARARKKRR